MRPIRISLILAAGLAAQNDMVTDVVLRAKNKPLPPGSPVTLEFSDNGAKQSIKELRHITGDALYVNGEKRPLPAQVRMKPIALVLQPSGQGNDRVLRQQLEEFLKGDADPSHYYGVFLVSFQLNILQEFTNDRQAVIEAINFATSGAQQSYIARSNERRKRLMSEAASMPAGEFNAAAAQAAMARYTLEVAQMDATMTNWPRLTLAALDSFATGGGAWPGRKAVAFFTWGMEVTYELDPIFRNLISRANRSQVSYYAFNITGATGTDRENIMTSRSPEANATGTETITTIPGMNTAESSERGMRSNTDNALRTLAEDTGGTLSTGTNDVRKAMSAMLGDVSDYHELVYDPGIESFDGSLRRTQVKAKEVKVRDRNGYFALSRAVLALGNVNTYELPMVTALAASPLPRDLDFRSGVVRLRSAKDEVTAAALLEFPMAGLTLTEDKKTSSYSGHLSMIVQVKAADGKVVKRFSRDQPLKGKLEQAGALKASNFNFREQFTVPPGRYTVEASVVDQTNKRVGARRTVFMAAAKPAGVVMSAPALVRGYQAGAKDLTPEEPFQFQGGRVTPTLGNTVRAVRGAQLALFFTVYPDSSVAEKPQGMVQYLKDGTVVGNAAFELPAADAQGRIQYVLSTPADSMPPGDYEVKITVKQGASTTQETTLVKIEAAPAA